MGTRVLHRLDQRYDPLAFTTDVNSVLKSVADLLKKLASAEAHADAAYTKYFDELINETAALLTSGGVAAAQLWVAMSALISADPRRMVRRPRQVIPSEYDSGPWGDWQQVLDESIFPWVDDLLSTIDTIDWVWPKISDEPLPDEVVQIAKKLPGGRRVLRRHSDLSDGSFVEPSDNREGGGQAAVDSGADPGDASQSRASQPLPPTGSPPTPTPVDVVNQVDPTPSVVDHPNPPQHTNVQPQQQRYVAGGNVPLPTRPDPGPQFTGGDGDGIISMGGRLLGGSTQSVPGFDFIAGTGEATPVFRPRRGYTPPSSGTGVQDGSPSRTVTDDGSGDGSGYASQNNQDPPDIWSVGGSGRHGREGDPDTSDSESQNRNRYSGDQSGSNSDNSSSTSSTASDGSTDSQGPQDRDRSGWQFGLISGGGDEDKNPSSPMTGDPNPYDPDGSDEAPTIPGRGFHPHGGDTAVAAAPNLPDPGDIATGGPFAGWTSGDGGDWGGNPHENPDPDDTGYSTSSNQIANALDANNRNPDDGKFMPALPPPGANEDDFWSGNNPHYMPYGYASSSPIARVTAIQRSAIVSRPVARAVQVRFK